MRDQLVAYFAAEKAGAWILLGGGVAALAAAVALVAARSGYRGMAWPLALLAIAELVVGAVVAWRTDAQVATLLDQLTVSPVVMAQAELARMAGVLRTFRVLLAVEVAMLAGGLLLSRIAGASDFLFAVGAGLVAQAGFMLVFDLFASRRAERYVELLRGAVG